MYEKIPKYPVAGSFLIVLAAFAFLKGTLGDSRAAEIMKQALLSAAMLYTMYLAGGKEIFRWEKGSLGESIWLYKSMLIINLALVVFTCIGFFTTIGLYIFKPIFMLVLGFGRSTYVGNPTE